MRARIRDGIQVVQLVDLSHFVKPLLYKYSPAYLSISSFSPISLAVISVSLSTVEQARVQSKGELKVSNQPAPIPYSMG